MMEKHEDPIGEEHGWDEYRYVGGYRRFMRFDSEADLYIASCGRDYSQGFKIWLYDKSPRTHSAMSYKKLLNGLNSRETTTEGEAIETAIRLAEMELGLPPLDGDHVDDGI